MSHWLRLSFGRHMSPARHEQEVGGAFHESGPRRIDLLEPIEFVVKLVVNSQGCRIPTRVRREATMENIEAAENLDIEKASKIAPQFRCGE